VFFACHLWENAARTVAACLRSLCHRVPLYCTPSSPSRGISCSFRAAPPPLPSPAYCRAPFCCCARTLSPHWQTAALGDVSSVSGAAHAGARRCALLAPHSLLAVWLLLQASAVAFAESPVTGSQFLSVCYGGPPLPAFSPPHCCTHTPYLLLNLRAPCSFLCSVDRTTIWIGFARALICVTAFARAAYLLPATTRGFSRDFAALALVFTGSRQLLIPLAFSLHFLRLATGRGILCTWRGCWAISGLPVPSHYERQLLGAAPLCLRRILSSRRFSGAALPFTYHRHPHHAYPTPHTVPGGSSLLPCLFLFRRHSAASRTTLHATITTLTSLTCNYACDAFWFYGGGAAGTAEGRRV